MKKRRKRKKEQIRFTAMSKLIGFVVILIVITVILFSMYEMDKTKDISALQYLICGTLAILGSYIGFYINMAKTEHIEDKKNQIKKELELIRRDGIITEEEKIKEEELKEELENMNVNLDELNYEENINTQ